jgi:3-phosphoshikimate 1-carboxyvinyltransferase
MLFFDEILPQLNVQVRSNEGKLPILVRGPLQPGNIEIDGSLSSQFLTGLLMAYAAADASDVTIQVTDLKSRPYIDLTLQVMKEMGLKVPICNNYQSFYFDGQLKVAKRARLDYTVEGDWSGASLLLVAGAIAGKVRVKGLNAASFQADRSITSVLLQAGAKLSLDDNAVEVEKARLDAFEFDARDCPDLFPPLVALAAHCKGRSKIKGLHRLKYKESDRGTALQKEFIKLGVMIEHNDDEMLVYGNEKLQVKDPNLDSHHDHRIAMACAVASLNADAEVTISNAGAVKKSYPRFWDHLKQLNAAISLKP